jgi:hypothetical protein
MKPMLRSLPLVLSLVLSLLGLLAGAPALADDPVRVNPTDPQPTCHMCPGTYIPLAELESYQKKALAEKLLDQQVRDIDIGKAHIGIGMVHAAGWKSRTRIPSPSTTMSARSTM